MKTQNQMHLNLIQNDSQSTSNQDYPTVSQELVMAIQELIYRMRHLGPMKEKSLDSA